MPIKITFNEEVFNDIYLPYLDNKKRFLLLYGGAGSGKSYFAAQRAIYACLKEKYYRLIFCRKIARTIRNSQFLLFKDIISTYELDAFFDIKDGNMVIECSNGNMLIAAGMNDPERIKSIQEPTHIWCEEADEFSKTDIIQLNLRLRTVRAEHNQIILTFNPTAKGWIYDSFFVKKEFDCEVVHTTYNDNRFVSEDYKTELKALEMQDELYYRIYTLGEWGEKRKGLIYTHWNLCEELPEGGDVIYGLDFGFNNPTAFMKIVIKDKELYVQEMIYRAGLTNTDLIELIKNINPGKSIIYCDAAEPQRVEELQRHGFNAMPCDKEQGSVKKGIDTIKSLPLHITTDSANVIKELKTYKWLETKDGDTTELPLKYQDHAMDAIRYAVHTHLIKPTGKYRIRIV